MVGKRNLPPDVDQRPEIKGASASTPGLAALDQEREGSMADEGGAAGAAMESQEEHVRRELAAENYPYDWQAEEDEDPPALLQVFLTAGAISALSFLVIRKLLR